MKIGQKNLRIFEIPNDDDTATIDFLRENFPLISDFLLVFQKKISTVLHEFLETLHPKPFLCAQNFSSGISVSRTGRMGTDGAPNTQNTPSIPQKMQNITPDPKPAPKILQKPVRSGQSVEHAGDVVIFGDVHDGAQIRSGGNLLVFGKNDGRLLCDGDILLLENSKKSLLFGGEIINFAECLGSGLKILTKDENGVKIFNVREENEAKNHR